MNKGEEDMSSNYIYIKKDEYKEAIELFKKYGIGCKESNCIIDCLYRAKKDYFDIRKNDVIFRFNFLDDRTDVKYPEPYSFGEKVFNIPNFYNDYLKRLASEGDAVAIRLQKFLETLNFDAVYDKHSFDFASYKDTRYMTYRLYDALPFSDREYSFINSLANFKFFDFKDEIAAEGKMTFDELFQFESVNLEPSEPEKKYMDKINALFDLLDNEIEETVRFPEDETKAVINIDLSSIKNELKEIAKDNGLDLSVSSKGLDIEIIEPYKIIKPLYMKDLKDLYRYIYEDSKLFRIRLARELRRKETGGFY